MPTILVEVMYPHHRELDFKMHNSMNKPRSEAEILEGLEEVYQNASKLSELSYVINESWVRRVRKVIVGQDGRKDLGGEFYLFRIFRDDEYGISVTSISPEDLNSRLELVHELAKKQGKLRSYRKTRRELRSIQSNQVLASIFEILVISDLIGAGVLVELAPPTGKGNQDCDARVYIDGRWIYVECKCLGYSCTDRVEQCGAGSIARGIEQVQSAICSKLDAGMQLETIAMTHPTVLFLALGFRAGHIEGYEAIEDYFSQRGSNCSAIFMGESAFIMKGMRPFYNNVTTFPLSKQECDCLERVARFHDYRIFREAHFQDNIIKS